MSSKEPIDCIRDAAEELEKLQSVAWFLSIGIELSGSQLNQDAGAAMHFVSEQIGKLKDELRSQLPKP